MPNKQIIMNKYRIMKKWYHQSLATHLHQNRILKVTTKILMTDTDLNEFVLTYYYY